MNSIKSKTKNFLIIENKAIAQVVALPEGDMFRIYVAWEWLDEAKKGFFAVCKSTNLFMDLSRGSINYAADYGTDITGSEEANRLFGNMFNTKTQ